MSYFEMTASRAAASRRGREAGVGLGDFVLVGSVQECQRPADGERGNDRPHEDRDLLAPRRRPHEEAGLQVLGGVAPVRDRHRDHARDRDRLHPVVDAGPAEQQENECDADERRDRHSRDRVR